MPEYIELQHRSLQAFLQDEYEQILFINSPDTETARALVDECERLDISYVRVPIHQDPSMQFHGFAINYALSQLILQKKEKVVLLENDCFLLRPFLIEQDFDMLDLAFPARRYAFVPNPDGPFSVDLFPEICYINPMFVYFDLRTLPEPHTMRWQAFYPINALEGDTGGPTYYYLRRHPQIRKRFITECPILETSEHWHAFPYEKNSHIRKQAPDYMLPYLIPLLEYCGPIDSVHIFHDFGVLHYSCGSNTWMHLPDAFRQGKWERIVYLVENLIAYHRLQEPLLKYRMGKHLHS